MSGEESGAAEGADTMLRWPGFGWRVGPRAAGFAVCVLLLASVAPVQAQQTLYADAANCPGPGTGTPADPYCKIQDAICYLKNNVPLGGTVLVRPGTYPEAIRIFKGISVVSTDGPATTVIDATGKPCYKTDCTVNTATTQCSVVIISSPTGGQGPTNADRLEGFRLVGGKGYLWSDNSSLVAGGIFVWGNSAPTITRNEIVGNTLTTSATKAFYGGGIYVDSNIGGGTQAAQPVITRNLIDGNVADPPAGTKQVYSSGIGGGIYAGRDSAPILEANTIKNNRAGASTKNYQYGSGGGIAIYGRTEAGSPRVAQNLIQANQSADWGGGIKAGGYYNPDARVWYSGVGTIENNVLDANTSYTGGGVYTDTTRVKIRSNTLADGIADFGGGVYVDDTQNPADFPAFVNDLITFNTATNASGGGGICVVTGNNPTVRYNDLFGNTPQNVAGGKTDADYIGVNGNLSLDPQYVNRTPPNKDFQLLSTSPVIDRGDNAEAPAQDKNGAPRIQDGDNDGTATIDPGAYEFSPDFDHDGTPDWQDPDDDNDGALDASDCASRTRGVSTVPGRIGNMLRFDKSGNGRLTWARGLQGHTSNVYRGTITPGQPWSYNETCFSSEVPGTEINDASTPAPGTCFYYLISARNVCGESAAGTDSHGVDHYAPAPCAGMNRDTDSDTIRDLSDSCPQAANVDQTDGDLDFVGDACDNCASMSNPDQANQDGDSRGDLCDNCPAAPNGDQADQDGDNVGNVCDNCASVYNPTQLDTDGDSLGDACDPDDDNDGVFDATDNCPLLVNPGQQDNDLDGLGDACDPDDDNDGILDTADNCPLAANSGQQDADSDGRGNECDNCPYASNPGQADGDGDGVGDLCDNCSAVSNPDQLDTDTDGLGNVCDPDDDGDTIADGSDNCPLDANADQLDTDTDGLGNVCDPDDDNDTVLDGADCAPLDPTVWSAPIEIQGLRVDKDASTHLSWTGQNPGTRHDISGGSLLGLRADRGTEAAECLIDDEPSTSWHDARPGPTPGDGYYYVVRGQNPCGTGTYGASSAGSERLPSIGCP